MASARATAAGFTLLEVLVALALLAITFAAALATAARSAADAAYLRDRTFGAWVGANELARAQLGAAWPAIGVSRGSSWMGQREWPWELRVVATADENVRRLEVKVGESEEQAATTLVGYVLRPQEAPKPGPGTAQGGPPGQAAGGATPGGQTQRLGPTRPPAQSRRGQRFGGTGP
jgi:general secretion pathway protein I